MNDELSMGGRQKRGSLDQRLAAYPELARQLHGLIDEVEASLAHGTRADEVEDRVVGRARQVGRQALADWAAQAQEHLSAQTPAQHPGAVRHAKKNSSGKPSSGRSRSRNKSGG